jgi:UDP-N-acetyl-2-amino-2-deoxyglucuronate dehydrogenase
MYKFAIIGAAGYVAPRHMQAIRDIGGDIVAVLDPCDSVGVLDKYSMDCLYFREPERFDRWLSKNHVDYVVVCSPNYLHDSHCLMAMRSGADVICEKPVVLNERNLDNLLEWELKTSKKVNVILQCRLHHAAIDAKEKYGSRNGFSYINVEYNTPRGLWYRYSWKGDIEKSGGLITNIGIHLFDLCVWIFGAHKKECKYKVEISNHNQSVGHVHLEAAIVNWDLSTLNAPSKRIFFIDGFSVDLTSGFTELHNESYKKIISGEGFSLEDARPSIRLVEALRNV